MTNKLYFFETLLLLAAVLLCSCHYVYTFDCPPNEQVTFEKQIGVRPLNTSVLYNPIFTYKSGETPTDDWLTLECVKRCLRLVGCHSVVILYQAIECIGLPQVDVSHLIVDNDATIFAKICMQLPESCRSKLWSVESSAGHRLLARDSRTWDVDNVTSSECSRMLTQRRVDGVQIRSSQFLLPQKDTGGYIFDGNDIENIPSARGKCILSTENKFTQPESYRVVNGETFYKENQCVEDYQKHIDRCSYEEFHNQTLKHYDVVFNGVSSLECKMKCENEVQFNCRGFTVIANENNFRIGNTPKPDDYICLLHSEDTLMLGSWLLTKRIEATYYRRVICLNISVECTPNAMTISYWPNSNFRGRLYVNGYSESCGVSGQGRDMPTRLVVPFHSSMCGVNQAFAYDAFPEGEKRTLMYTMLVVQNDPIIQTQGDRFVRTGCVAAPVFNLTLGAVVNFLNDSDYNAPMPSAASAIINTTGVASVPKIRMYIIREPDIFDQVGHMSDGAVALGETIELRIEAEQLEKEKVDIHAYHMVASSQLGDSSVLLLDGRGCPTGQVDFPALRRTESNGIIRLASRFKAFRFPNSQVVKFNVMVQFCAGYCGPIYCEDQNLTHGRSSRSINGNATEREDYQYENATVDFLNARVASEGLKRAHVVVASSDPSGRLREMCKELSESRQDKIPLELSLVVASNDVLTAESLVYGENNRILVAGIEEPSKVNSNMICIHEALFISITFIWLIVQILILAGCMIMIKRYRSFADENRQQGNYQSFDNLGCDAIIAGKRVHWRDQSVDILHSM